MIDSHAHITHKDYAEEGARPLIERAAAAGVEEIVCVAYDVPSCREVIDLAREHDPVCAVVGVHPHEADRVTGEELDRVEEMAREPEVVGIGETGLDFFRHWADPERQRSLFRHHLQMAGRVGKPVVIHDRDAHDEVVDGLQAHASGFPGGVMHCFSGDVSLMNQVLPLGFYISIPGTITFSKVKGGRLDEVVRQCPEDRLLLETDCPWLTPTPHRGKRNEPSYVPFILKRVAEILGRDEADVDRITTENTLRLFRPGG